MPIDINAYTCASGLGVDEQSEHRDLKGLFDPHLLTTNTGRKFIVDAFETFGLPVDEEVISIKRVRSAKEGNQ
jgi:hypothetical protein